MLDFESYCAVVYFICRGVSFLCLVAFIPLLGLVASISNFKNYIACMLEFSVEKKCWLFTTFGEVAGRHIALHCIALHLTLHCSFIASPVESCADICVSNNLNVSSEACTKFPMYPKGWRSVMCRLLNHVPNSVIVKRFKNICTCRTGLCLRYFHVYGTGFFVCQALHEILLSNTD
jgi:hypothetical protein